jgi:hypothetical protein
VSTSHNCARCCCVRSNRSGSGILQRNHPWAASPAFFFCGSGLRLRLLIIHCEVGQCNKANGSLFCLAKEWVDSSDNSPFCRSTKALLDSCCRGRSCLSNWAWSTMETYLASSVWQWWYSSSRQDSKMQLLASFGAEPGLGLGL